ncbi:MAG: recombinase family protein [Bdellovibrionales bacterium]
MAIFGYARASSASQSMDIQIEALERHGCDFIKAEKVSGTSRKGRSELEHIMEYIRESDTLVVTRIDRLARSVKDLQDIVLHLRQRKANLIVTEQPIDTGTPAGKAFLDMLGVFAEFETNLRKERQLEGIAKAKAKGVYKGRKKSIDGERVKVLRRQGMGATAIAKELSIGRASVYRYLDE